MRLTNIIAEPAQAGFACVARGVSRRATERIPVELQNLHQAVSG
jgi:hypothetical protein